MTQSSREIALRVPGLAHKDSRIHDALSRFTGYEFHVEGNDLVAFDGDPNLSKDVPIFVTRSVAHSLAADDAAQVLAEELLNAKERPNEDKPPSDLPVLGGLGLISDLRKVSLGIYFSTRQQLRSAISEQLIPLMTKPTLRGEMGVIIHSDIAAFYTRVSAPKFIYLVERTNADFDKVSALALNQGIFRKLLPDPFEPREMAESFLLLQPYVVGFTFTRATSSIVVLGRRIFHMNQEAFNGVAATLYVDTAPLTSKGKLALLNRGRHDGESLEFLDIAIAAANGYWRYLTNPLNWLSSEKTWEALRQMKGLSLGRLMCADMASLVLTQSQHARNRITFDFFDKLASFSVATLPPGSITERPSKLEARCANFFLTEAGVNLAVEVLTVYRRSGGEKVTITILDYGRQIAKSLKNDYAKMHSELNQKSTAKGLLKIIRTLRNLSHGTFLSDDPFEGSFSMANAFFPGEMWRLPWLYMLALGLNTRQFIEGVHAALPKLNDTE